MSDLFSISGVDKASQLDMPDASIEFLSDFLSYEKADDFKNVLLSETDWREEEIQVWGKWHKQPRLIAWYGDEGASYAYSGRRLKPKPWTPTLSELRYKVEQATSASFNSVLLNYYRDQNDRMGWHSDNESELGVRPTIASLSLGDTRIFLLRHKVRKDLKVRKMELSNGSLLIMSGCTQEFWQHAINKESRPAGPRVNLTFRMIH